MTHRDRPVFTSVFVLVLVVYFLGWLSPPAGAPPRSAEFVVGAFALVAAVELLARR